MRFYTDLLRHWINRVIATSPSEVQSVDKQTLSDLVAHVSLLSTSLLLSQPAAAVNIPLASSILSFYELLSSSSKPNIVPIILPPPRLAYLLAQTTSLLALSRLCGVYANYKTAFDRHPHPISSYYSQPTLNSFNSCLRDLYNLIWGSKALASSTHSAGFYIHPSVRDALHSYLNNLDREYAISQSFGLSHSPMIAACAAVAWRTLEEGEIEREGYDRENINWHKGPVTARALDVLKVSRGVNVSWETYRIFVLRWLAERGCAGLKDLLFATHVRLKDSAAKK